MENLLVVRGTGTIIALEIIQSNLWQKIIGDIAEKLCSQVTKHCNAMHIGVQQFRYKFRK